MLRIPFEWFGFAFECFESLSNRSNLDSNASNPFLLVRICIRILQIPFRWLGFAFESFEWCSNFYSNPFLIVRICIQMLRIPFEFTFECFESLSNGSQITFDWFEFGFECFQSFSNCLNVYLNTLNPF